MPIYGVPCQIPCATTSRTLIEMSDFSNLGWTLCERTVLNPYAPRVASLITAKGSRLAGTLALPVAASTNEHGFLGGGYENIFDDSRVYPGWNRCNSFIFGWTFLVGRCSQTTSTNSQSDGAAAAVPSAATAKHRFASANFGGPHAQSCFPDSTVCCSSHGHRKVAPLRRRGKRTVGFYEVLAGWETRPPGGASREGGCHLPAGSVICYSPAFANSQGSDLITRTGCLPGLYGSRG